MTAASALTAGGIAWTGSAGARVTCGRAAGITTGRISVGGEIRVDAGSSFGARRAMTVSASMLREAARAAMRLPSARRRSTDGGASWGAPMPTRSIQLPS